MVGEDERRRTFSRLMEAYGVALKRLAAAYVSDSAAREDLFQEIALAVWNGIPGFRGDASERTWLYRIAHNTAATERFLAALRQLPTLDVQIVTMHLDGLPYAEIAAVVGLTQTNVARLTRIRETLAIALASTEQMQ